MILLFVLSLVSVRLSFCDLWVLCTRVCKTITSDVQEETIATCLTYLYESAVKIPLLLLTVEF